MFAVLNDKSTVYRDIYPYNKNQQDALLTFNLSQ